MKWGGADEIKYKKIKFMDPDFINHASYVTPEFVE